MSEKQIFTVVLRDKNTGIVFSTLNFKSLKDALLNLQTYKDKYVGREVFNNGKNINWVFEAGRMIIDYSIYCSKIELSQKEKLADQIQHMDEQQAKVLNEIIQLASSGMPKGQLMEFVYNGDTNSIDSALPIDYIRRVEEIYPQFDSFLHASNWQEQNRGTIDNLATMFLDKLKDTFK